MTEKDTNLPPKKRKVSENTAQDRTEPKSASENVKSCQIVATEGIGGA